MKTSTPIAFLACILTQLFVASCWIEAAPNDETSLSWQFLSRRAAADPDGPLTDVCLAVHGKSRLIRKNVNAGFTAIGPGQWDVPADALTACLGWWAGGGEVLFVRKEGNRFAVYHARRDEGAQPEPFRCIRRIPER